MDYFILIIFHDGGSPEFFLFFNIDEHPWRRNSGTLHDIFSTPPNLVTALNNVIKPSLTISSSNKE